MNLGPILRSLLHNKTRLILISFEVALTLAIVVNCLNLLFEMRGKMLRPTGIDEKNIIVATVLPFGPEYRDDKFIERVRTDDLAAMRALPGVKAAFPARGAKGRRVRPPGPWRRSSGPAAAGRRRDA